jgi:hypothetical protein
MKRLLLIIANIIGFFVLGIIFCFYFVFQWGVSWQSVALGLPLLAGMTFLAVSTVFMVIKRSCRWGLLGFGIGWVAFIYTVVIFWFLSYLLVGAPQNGPKEINDTQEKRILELVLLKFSSDYREFGYRYIVISPEFSTHFIENSPYELDKTRNYIIEKSLLINGDDRITSVGIKDEETIKLLDAFLLINQNNGNLTLKSAPEDGYYIDYDNKFSGYFPNNFFKRLFWFLRYTTISIKMEISYPAYDPQTGLVMEYLGEPGYGSLYVFKYGNGELTLFNRYNIYRTYD